MNIIELSPGVLIDINTLEGLYFQKEQDYGGRQGWHSPIIGTTKVWWWDEESVPIIKKAFLARKPDSNNAGFTCKYCGGHNG